MTNKGSLRDGNSKINFEDLDISREIVQMELGMIVLGLGTNCG